MESILQLERITKNYGPVSALNQVSLRVEPGITGLLGPNGAGKTTLIKVLLGLVRCNHGSGHVLGHPLGTNQRAIRAGVGYLPEDDCYLPGLSGVETVQFMGRLSGYRAVPVLRRAHEVLDYCGMGQERYRDVATYSTGMRQKLKFAQAIVHDPDLLILDEPTAGLDPEERLALLHRIRQLGREAGKTVLLSTHILPDVQTLCDRVVIMVRGEIQRVERLDVLAAASEPIWYLTVDGEPSRFAERLQQAGWQVRIDHLDRILVRGVDRTEIQSVWRWAVETEVRLRSLHPIDNALEDAFLDAIEVTDDADS